MCTTKKYNPIMKRLFSTAVVLLFHICLFAISPSSSDDLAVFSLDKDSKTPCWTSFRSEKRDFEYWSLTVKHIGEKGYDQQLIEKKRGEIVALLAKDASMAYEKKELKVDGKLYYAIYLLPKSSRQLNRFLFYKDMTLQTKDPKNEVTLIFIETKMSLNEIEKKYKKQ